MSFKILSLDGGGIRGLITAVWLHKLETELNRPIAECFDLIVGTSTGSILACAVAAKIPAEQIVSLYRERTVKRPMIRRGRNPLSGSDELHPSGTLDTGWCCRVYRKPFGSDLFPTTYALSILTTFNSA